jgi:hypothetical protein
MGREVFLIRGNVVVWSGMIETAEGREVRSTRDCFEDAWKRALSEGVVTPEDAGRIQFRTTLSA